MSEGRKRLWGVFTLGSGVGILAGLLGIGGGALLVPLLVLLFGFEQHRAQGTSLVALVPPTGLLAFLNYARAGAVDWKVGLLLMPGMILGAVLGSRAAIKLSPQRMRRVSAVLLFILGAWQALSAWSR